MHVTFQLKIYVLRNANARLYESRSTYTKGQTRQGCLEVEQVIVYVKFKHVKINSLFLKVLESSKIMRLKIESGKKPIHWFYPTQLQMNK